MAQTTRVDPDHAIGIWIGQDVDGCRKYVHQYAFIAILRSLVNGRHIDQRDLGQPNCVAISATFRSL